MAAVLTIKYQSQPEKLVGFDDKRIWVVIWIVLLLVAFWACPWAMTVAVGAERIDWSGNLGYTYRSLTNSSKSSNDTVSNQGRLTLNASSYLWQPWISTVQANLTVTQDKTEFDNNSDNEITILTGDLNLGILPRSRTPFNLSYHASDSKVDVFSMASPVTTLGSQEFETTRLGLTQSYFTEKGDRFQARYDVSDWSSSTGETYDDELFGLEMDLRLPKQKIIARTSYQETDQSQTTQHSENLIFNVDHFYYPTRALRVDTMASLYDFELTSIQPLNSTNLGDSATDLTQLSSFVFWRPADRLMTVSGGIRIFDLDGATSLVQTGVLSLSATAGMIYQYTKHLRLDANIDISSNKIDRNDKQANTATSDTAESSKQRAGVIYQSDIKDIFSGFTYQWYASGSAANQSTETENFQTFNTRLGHDANKSWLLGDASSLRLSFSQVVNENEQTGDIESSTQRLDNSASVGWDQHAGGGTSYIQLTVRDARGFGDDDSEEQFANFQAVRNQTISRRSSLSGNLTIQSVRQKFGSTTPVNTVTTTTGQVNYRQGRVFGVNGMRFLSDLRISQASEDNGFDRAEWENRLDYTIGLLDISLSWRMIDTGNEEFDLWYAQVTRGF